MIILLILAALIIAFFLYPLLYLGASLGHEMKHGELRPETEEKLKAWRESQK